MYASITQLSRERLRRRDNTKPDLNEAPMNQGQEGQGLWGKRAILESVDVPGQGA